MVIWDVHFDNVDVLTDVFWKVWLVLLLLLFESTTVWMISDVDRTFWTWLICWSDVSWNVLHICCKYDFWIVELNVVKNRRTLTYTCCMCHLGETFWSNVSFQVIGMLVNYGGWESPFFWWIDSESPQITWISLAHSNQIMDAASSRLEKHSPTPIVPSKCLWQIHCLF